MPSVDNKGKRAGIDVSAVSKSFGVVQVLREIELKVEPGAFVCLLGPSGCGKTTLLRCIAGLERPDEGRIAIGENIVVDMSDGVFVPPNKRGLGMVFQSYALWPHMNVEGHIAYPLRHRGVPRAEQHERIVNVMRLVGLPNVLERRPNQLSGGQQQRVALARALVSEPPVLLLDEPLSNLDASLRIQLRRELRHLHERLGTTTVLVTHDQEEASALADTIALMHQGRIIQAGTSAEIFDRPRTRFVAEFVGFDNFVRGRVSGMDSGKVIIAAGAGGEFSIMSDAALTANAEVLVAARSDSLSILPWNEGGDRMLAGTVQRTAKLGRGFEYEIMAGDQMVVVRDSSHAEAHFAVGDKVGVNFVEARSVVVTDDGGGRAQSQVTGAQVTGAAA